MTDQELMQQALEALTAYDGTNGVSQRKRVLAALRERLAQPVHHDPIGDAQDKLIAEQLAPHDYRTRYDRGCYKCGSHYCPANCPEPSTGNVLMDAYHAMQAKKQPQMQPCAGRNCGSIDPNLHSAECFEDYEKETGMNQWQGLTDEEIIDVLHPLVMADISDEATDYEIARAIEAKLKDRNA